MSVINNNEKITEQENVQDKTIYQIPAVIRKEKDEISFEKAFIIALLLHPATIVILLLSSLILKLLGIDLSLFHKPDLKPKDIEFVLVEKEAPPIDKNTKNRADKNSQAGGKHDPKRPVSLPQTSAPKSPDKKPTSPAPSKPAQKQPAKPQVKPQPAAQPKAQQPVKQPQQPAPQQQAPKPTTQAPKPTAPKPAAPTASAPKPNPSSNFNIPIPKSNIPQIAQPTTSAPVTSAPKIGGGSSSGAAGGTGSGAPSPSFSPTSSGNSGAGGTGTGAGGGGRFSNGTGTGKGNVGNPGPGNPNGRPGIDAIKEPDFGPYMKELQRRIKMNWDPPKGNESKRVVLLFKIARDGRLLNVSVHRSSGLETADKAAINAVKLTAPFRPLPPEFKGDHVDIQFTFDYNVLGASLH